MDRDDIVEDEPQSRRERWKQWRRTPWFERSRRSRAQFLVFMVIWSVLFAIAWQFVREAFGW